MAENETTGTNEGTTSAPAQVSRRTMLLQAAAASGFVTLWLSGCDDEGGGGGGGDEDAGHKHDGDDPHDSGDVPDANGGNDAEVPKDAAADAPPDYDLACINDPTISGHPGHAITIPEGHLTSIQERTYSIQSGAGHDHEVTLTVQNFNDLIAGNAVQVTSTQGGGGNHTHNLSWNC